ncbi:MAG: TfoX/Sxy family protein [Chloroflexota bacterium]
MPFDITLADRIREIVQDEPGISEKRMFGGLAFRVDARMAVAASGGGGILVRVDPGESSSLLADPQVQRMEMRGRPMDGWLRVSSEAVVTQDALRAWVQRGVGYARSLPEK